MVMKWLWHRVKKYKNPQNKRTNRDIVHNPAIVSRKLLPQSSGPAKFISDEVVSFAS